MRISAGLLLAAMAMVVPATAAAEEDFGFRVTPGALEALEQAAQSMVPEQIAFEDLEAEVLGCAIHLLEGSVDLDVDQVELEALQGALRAGVILDLEAFAEVDVCGSMTCDVSASATPVEAALELALGASDSEWIDVHGVDAELSLEPRQFEVDIANCEAGDFLSSIRGALFELLRPLIEERVGERVGDRVAEVLTDALPQTIRTDDMTVELGLTELGIDSMSGFDLAGWAMVSAAGATSGRQDMSAPGGEALPANFGPGDFAIAASDRLINQVLRGAWEAGMLATALDDLAPSIPLSEDGLAQQLGLPAGSEIQVEIAMNRAPEVAFSREGEGASIRLQELVVEVAVGAPGQRGDTIEIAADAYLRAGVAVSGAGALVLEPEALDMTHLMLTGGSREVAADPARLAVFLEDVGVPLLAERLAGIPIVPALSPMENLYVSMRHLETKEGWLRAGMDLVVPDPEEDFEPPRARFVEPPPTLAAGLTRIPVTGADDTTPAPLLRYEATLDGVPITDGPEFLSAIPVSAADGEYVLEVTAIDLVGKADPQPLRALLVVDGVPPELEVNDSPAHTAGTSARASWRASDDRGVVTTRWELFAVGDDGAAREVVREGEAGPSDSVSLDGLRSGTHYVLRITAVDEAGNVTSEDFGFGSVQGGCSAAGGGGPASLLVVLGALFMLRSRRLFRRGSAAALGVILVGVAGVVSLAPPASAQGIGTHFSGPTDADGAAAFWNPAAMSRGEGTDIYAASGLSLIRIRFDADSAGSSRTFVPKPEPTLGAYTDELGEDWRVGFTVGAPQIDGATWARDDGAGGITRYYATSARYLHITATPAVSYRATPWLAVGGGVRFVNSQMEAQLDRDIGSTLNMTLGSSDPDAPFPYAAPVLAAPTELSASGWGVGLVAGALITPPAPVVIGFGVHSPSTSKASGHVRADYPQQLRDFVAEAEPDVELPELAGDVRADLEMPLMTFSSVAVEPAPGWELVFDYRFIGRASVANTDVIVTESTSPTVSDTAVVRGYRNRHSIGLRAGHWIPGVPVVGALRVRYESNSVPEETASPSNVDFHKLELGGAALWTVNEQLDVIAQYSRYILGSRRIDQSLNRPLAEPSLAAFNKPSPTGSYSGASDYLAFGVTTHW